MEKIKLHADLELYDVSYFTISVPFYVLFLTIVYRNYTIFLVLFWPFIAMLALLLIIWLYMRLKRRALKARLMIIEEFINGKWWN